MKIAAAIFADFEQAPAGGPSHLRTTIAGQTILARTLWRLAKVDGVDGRHLIVRRRDEAVAREALQAAGLGQQVLLWPNDPGVRSRRELICAARKWSLHAWRGNPLGLGWFDEFVDPPTVAQVLQKLGVDALLCLDGHQPLLDPAIAQAMLAHAREHADECKTVFTQAPPGLAGVLIRAECLADLLELEIPYGLLLAYRPELPQPDPITNPACYHVAPEITQTAARLTGDTLRSRELLELVIAELGEDATAGDICGLLQSGGHGRAGRLPEEVELELTTDDPLPDSTLRPRGGRAGQRQLGDLQAVSRLAEELAAYDDRLVFLGGHGDPLRHPQFAEVCQILRSKGIFGIAVATPLAELSDEVLEALFAQRVDIVEVQLDAMTSTTYQRIHKSDFFAQVLANVERLERVRVERMVPQPIVVCSQTRCAATLGELETFHDTWIKATGGAVIRGYNDYCGLLPADSLLPIGPPLRGPCRRLASRLMLLADGRVALCGQDLRGERPLGNWVTGRVSEVWSGAALRGLRAAHGRVELESLPLCQRCHEWFRP